MPSPMLSFIVPAYNEEAHLAPTLQAIHAAAKESGHPYELIVVNDGSNDATAQLAAEAGAIVESVKFRHIAAVRNRGAKVSSGRILFFIDADTRISPELVRGAVQAIEAGAVGGGAPVRLEAWYGLGGAAFTWVWNLVSRIRKWAAGCFVYVERGAFEAVGGFDEQYFAAEEVQLSKALNRQGRMVILRTPVITSGRKIKTHTIWDSVKILFRMLVTWGGSLRKREGLEFWYGERKN